MKSAVFLGNCLLAYQSAAGEKNFPIQFQAPFADLVPATTTFGDVGSCSTRLRAEGKVHNAGITDTFHPSVVFSPGTVLRGRESHRFDRVIDLLDESGAKPMAHRYFVRDLELVAP
jgi:hypothetical protein